MKPKDFDVTKLIETLESTEETLESALQELYPQMTLEDLSVFDYREIETSIFICDRCGCWKDISVRCGTDGNGDVCDMCEEDELESEEL